MPTPAETTPLDINLTGTIPAESAQQRLDQALASLFSDYSRSRIQSWIRNGWVQLNGTVCTQPRQKVVGEEAVLITAECLPEDTWEAEAMDLPIVYEDDAVIIVNKPAGWVVHPAAGNLQGTLLNALLHHAPELAVLPRAGIVHRLDKDTSGLLVVARTLAAHHHLVEQLQAREFLREYEAIACGILISGDTIDLPIGRHPHSRTRMAVTEKGKPAVTHYRVAERYRGHTRLRVKLETGRTHQIRVHMAAKRHPLLGDSVYGERLRFPKGASEALCEQLRQFKRQALHAAQLGITHPTTGETLSWQAPLPDDMQQLIEYLLTDARSLS